MSELSVTANIDNLDKVIAFVEDILHKHNCCFDSEVQLDVAVEEVFVNIAQYAYPPKDGNVLIKCTVENDKAIITFTDSGVYYDPLKMPDPDVIKQRKENQVGGLGIFLVKKSMDKMVYEYKDGKNILTIIKHIRESND